MTKYFKRSVTYKDYVAAGGSRVDEAGWIAEQGGDEALIFIASVEDGQSIAFDATQVSEDDAVDAFSQHASHHNLDEFDLSEKLAKFSEGFKAKVKGSISKKHKKRAG